MNKFKKIFFCIASVCIILVSMCPISASAESHPLNTFSFPFSKPSVTDHSGYAELLYESPSTGYRFVTVVSWYFTPSVSVGNTDTVSDMLNIYLERDSGALLFSCTSDPGTNGFLGVTTATVAGITLNDYFVSTQPTYIRFGFQNDYNLIGVHYYGAYNTGAAINNASDPDFYVVYGDSSVILDTLNQVVSSLGYLSSIMPDEDYTGALEFIITSINATSDKITDLNKDFDDLNNFLVRKFIDLFNLYDDILSDLESILSNTDELENWLAVLNDGNVSIFNSVEEIKDFMFAFDTYLSEMRGMFDNLYWLQLDSNGILYEINGKLDTIISLLQAFSDEDFTEFDDSILDDYLEQEESLLDDSNVSTDVFDVEINPDAMASVFDIFDTVLNVHPKIIGFIVAVLSLGLIALILGR